MKGMKLDEMLLINWSVVVDDPVKSSVNCFDMNLFLLFGWKSYHTT